MKDDDFILGQYRLRRAVRVAREDCDRKVSDADHELYQFTHDKLREEAGVMPERMTGRARG